ncbi:MAG: hypothetical protein O2912_06215 [Proteobacteria bacterium]|nr:hypothetical protein [Pseudomonadota bacterium]
MKRFLIALILFAALGVFTPFSALHAADKDGNYLLMGLGGDTCRQWATARRIETPTLVEMESWLLGYLTATNVWRANTGDVSGGLSSDQMFTWMDRYCKDHQDERIGEAARNLVHGLDELSAQRKSGK